LTAKLPSDIRPEELAKQFDRDYFIWNGKGEAKGYRGHYADFPENLKFLEHIKSLKPESVLDVGCAYGFLVKRLNDSDIPSKGIEISPFCIAMRATDDVQLGDVLELPFSDNAFDLVISVELLEHIPEKYVDKALEEMARVSKRGVHWIAYKEVDDLFQTKDITHINIKPYQWWVDKVKEICGSTHKVVYKETDWYPKPTPIPQGGKKRGLNVGCFVNMLLNTIETQWLNIDALDLATYAKAYGYNFQQLDARTLPFPDDSFDYLVASHFLEHLTSEEAQQFLSECHRVLKSGGLARIVVPDAEKLIMEYLAGFLSDYDIINPECEKAETQLGKLQALLLGGHKSVFDESELISVMKQAGFVPERKRFNETQIPGIFDYHPDLSLYVEASNLKVVTPHKEGLKIALLSTPFLKTPPDHYGGLEMVVADLAAALSKLGHDITLFAAKSSKPIGDYRVFETVDPVFNYSTDWGKINWYEKEKAHYETFKDRLKEFDIVHGHGWFGFEYLAKRDGLASHVCHTHHGGLNWKTKPCEKMNLIAISKFMAETYARQLNTHVVWVYNGIDLDAYPYKAKKGERLIYVGRFVSFKQPHIAIEVAKKLGMGLDLVGGAYEEPYFSQHIKPQCDGKQIVLHQEASHKLKVRLLQNAKALLFPSKMGEPFGLCAVEANCCGTPVIALRDGAIPEVVLDAINGYVCNTPSEMAAMVRQVDKIKPENCRAIVEQNFSRRIMAERYLKLYRNIVVENNEW